MLLHSPSFGSLTCRHLLPISGKPAPICQWREGQELIFVKCPHHCRFFRKSAGAKVRPYVPERADNKLKPTSLSCLCSRCALLDELEWEICSLRATHMLELKASNPSLTGSFCPDLHRRRKRHNVMRHENSPCPGNSRSFSWKICPNTFSLVKENLSPYLSVLKTE